MWTAIRNKPIRKKLFIGLIALSLTAPAGAAVLQPFTATYKAWHGFIGLGQATFTLQHWANDCWSWHGVADPSGLAALLIGKVTETSDFCVAKDGTLLPQFFKHYEEGDSEDSYTLTFDWSGNQDQARVRYNGDTTFTAPRGAIDPFLIQIAARLWLARAEDPASLSSRKFTIVDEDDVEHYRLAVSNGKRIDTGAGTFNTLRVARVDDDDQSLVFWVAPKLDYLPVKVEHRQDGDTNIKFVLDSIERPKKSAKSRSTAATADHASGK